ncbi:MAG: hypothetical protein A2066_03190 [Bacteroidetes bacterium GWB2_41_8]|nr:MAG: hypothetical protein A2066_03190 [Bacteroidetes bacterium GWB2_41_8]
MTSNDHDIPEIINLYPGIYFAATQPFFQYAHLRNKVNNSKLSTNDFKIKTNEKNSDTAVMRSVFRPGFFSKGQKGSGLFKIRWNHKRRYDYA